MGPRSRPPHLSTSCGLSGAGNRTHIGFILLEKWSYTERTTSSLLNGIKKNVMWVRNLEKSKDESSKFGGLALSLSVCSRFGCNGRVDISRSVKQANFLLKIGFPSRFK